MDNWKDYKFRGKSESDGTWCYGMLQHQTIHTRHSLDQINPLICNAAHDNIRVLPETVGMYSGLPDIHGKPIHGDDILESQVGDKNRWIVSFEDGGFIISLIGHPCPQKKRHLANGTDDLCKDNIHFYALAIIGNIHDNPEVLRV